jgi:hypothetical protein
MSTPISRNNKLTGAALYAPRHVRERLFEVDEDATAAAPEPPEPLEQSEDDPPPEPEEPDGLTEADLEEIHERVDQAIREAIELRLNCEASEPSQVRSPYSPSAAMTQGMSDGLRGELSDGLSNDLRDHWAPPRFISGRESDRDSPAAAASRRSQLDCEMVPEPPAAMLESSTFPLFMRFALVTAFAAIVAYGLTMLSSQPGVLWLKGATDRVASIASQLHAPPAAPQPRARLVVEDRQAFANEPLPLALSVENGRQSESLLLDGLPQGTTLSAGMAASPFSWQLPFDKLRGLSLFAPRDFVGVMNTTVDLFGADRRLLDSRAMQLKWIAREPKPVAAPAVATAVDPVVAARPAMPAIEPIEAGEAAMLMQRGRDFLSSGDISAARVAFRRLADAGIADGALALADTYDPDYLVAHNVVGVQGDRAMARALYQRAKELGSAEAGRILARMVAK